MSQGAFVTLVGFVAQDPRLRETKSGRHVADVRVGITPRFRDGTTGEWRDGQTSYYTVDCWQRLADHARASLRKGDPVLIKGRLRTHSYEDKTGQPKYDVRITADTLGHDLTRGAANYIRPQRPHVNTEADPARDPVGHQAQGSPNPGGEAEDIFDEEAIERFGQDLNDADLAGRALAEAEYGDGDGDEEEDEDQAAEAAEPPISAAPF